MIARGCLRCARLSALFCLNKSHPSLCLGAPLSLIRSPIATTIKSFPLRHSDFSVVLRASLFSAVHSSGRNNYCVLCCTQPCSVWLSSINCSNARVHAATLILQKTLARGLCMSACTHLHRVKQERCSSCAFALVKHYVNTSYKRN